MKKLVFYATDFSVVFEYEIDAVDTTVNSFTIMRVQVAPSTAQAQAGFPIAPGKWTVTEAIALAASYGTAISKTIKLAMRSSDVENILV